MNQAASIRTFVIVFCLCMSAVFAEEKVVAPVPANLQPPSGHTEVLRFKANGVQIYKSVSDGNGGFKWEFEAPLANIYGEAGKHMGRHFEGPTWESNDGSKVKKVSTVPVVKVNAPGAGDIQWLLIQVKDESGDKRGSLSAVQFVQRIETQGGVMPTTPPTKAEQRAFVEYAATYVFYN